jgi:hypothetical protein
MTVVLSQHADQHRPERPVLLAVDQNLSLMAETSTPKLEEEAEE